MGQLRDNRTWQGGRSSGRHTRPGSRHFGCGRCLSMGRSCDTSRSASLGSVSISQMGIPALREVGGREGVSFLPASSSHLCQLCDSAMRSPHTLLGRGRMGGFPAQAERDPFTVFSTPASSRAVLARCSLTPQRTPGSFRWDQPLLQLPGLSLFRACCLLETPRPSV